MPAAAYTPTTSDDTTLMASSMSRKRRSPPRASPAATAIAPAYSSTGASQACWPGHQNHSAYRAIAAALWPPAWPDLPVGEVVAEVAGPVQGQVDGDRQREQGADGHGRDPGPALAAGEAPQRRHGRLPVLPHGGREHGRTDHRDDEQETGVPVDEEPPGQREDPGVPDVPGRDRRRRDQEDAVHDDVQVRHPVRVDRGRMHGPEDEDDGEARRGRAQRSRPAVHHGHDQGQQGAVERRRPRADARSRPRAPRAGRTGTATGRRPGRTCTPGRDG